MKQEGTIYAKKGTNQVIVKLKKAMPSVHYHVILAPQSSKANEVAMGVFFNSRTTQTFIIHFSQVLTSRLKIAYIVELPV